MTKQSFILAQKETRDFQIKALYWANQFNAFLGLLSNGHEQQLFRKYEFLLGVNIQKHRLLKSIDSLDKSQSMLLGHLSYNLTFDFNPQLNRSIQHQPSVDFGDLCFFEPEILIQQFANQQEIIITTSQNSYTPEEVFNAINQQSFNYSQANPKISFSSIDQKQYLKDVEAIKQHLYEGDCYELNYCVAHQGELKTDDWCAITAFTNLVTNHPTPFSSLYKLEDLYALSLSPERFITLQDNVYISQPIKGTAPRSENSIEDEQLANNLRNSEKNKAENMMIVDLVRNDLSRIANPGSIEVPELCSIYSYPNVHQMVSTITGDYNGKSWQETIKATFPMGSMTGAPKLKVMQLIQRYEPYQRGLYSGSLGYIDQEKNECDFNVVIRTLFYNKSNNVLGFSTGGAITIDSDPQEEYEEMLLKGKSIMSLFNQNKND